MRMKPIHDTVSIVLLGAFNPTIIQPGWLALKDLIPAEAVNAAVINITHPDISQFSVADMLFQIQPNRFFIQCKTLYEQLIKDLVLSTFQEHLPETPVWAMGLNRKIEFSCESERKRDRFGQMLAPRNAWGSWGKQIDSPDPAAGLHGGMMRVVMRQQPRPDNFKGYIQADVQPSLTDNRVVVVDINNHFELTVPNEAYGSADAMEALSTHWKEALEFAAYIVDELMETVMELQS